MLTLSACSSTQPLKHEEPNPQIFQVSNGLEVALTPPQGFKLTPEHYGFVQPESFSRIKITEKELPYKAYISNLTKENLLKNQLQLIDLEQINVSGALCTLITMRQNIAGVYFEKLWLVAGDNLSSIQVEASYPEGSSQHYKTAIKSSLLSLSVVTEKSQRIYSGLPFRFTSTPNFIIKQRYANSIVLLSLDEVESKTTVVVSHGKLKQEIEDIKQLSDHFLKNGQHYKNVEILTSEMIKIDKIPALASTSYVTLNDKATFVYQVLSYQKGKFLLIQGQTPKENRVKFKEQVANLFNEFSFK
ncbi:hypothetical protein D1094_16600 [Colwellia sp. RSH04]|nr:hypothetical protein D1094_16600 [Colwellia sp. RSH04]